MNTHTHTTRHTVTPLTDAILCLLLIRLQSKRTREGWRDGGMERAEGCPDLPLPSRVSWRETERERERDAPGWNERKMSWRRERGCERPVALRAERSETGR